MTISPHAVAHAHYLQLSEPAAIARYLYDQGWLPPDVRLTAVEKAGEGNMNLVLRIRTDRAGSFILKQSRPWVEKYPQLAAPAERANTEGLFLAKVGANTQLSAFSPAVRHTDPKAHVLLLEDLGPGNDLTYLYRPGQQLGTAALTVLAAYLHTLHTNFTRDRCDFYIENRALRQLNAEHIFDYPFRADNGLDLDALTPGLSAVAATYRHDEGLGTAVADLKARYLANGDTLLHGDYYPGSLLQTDAGLKVIDPEFCFFGDPEFDLGVLRAHLLMARQPDATIGQLLAQYRSGPGFSVRRYDQYTGIEVMRRLLGLAQLPLTLSLAEKTALLQRAHQMLLS